MKKIIIIFFIICLIFLVGCSSINISPHKVIFNTMREKENGGKAFAPSKIESSSSQTVTKKISVGNEMSYITVSSANVGLARFYVDDKIKIEKWA